MRNALLAIGFILAAVTPALSQGDYVHEAKRLTWDHDHPELVEEWRMYCQDTAGVVPGPSTLVASIAASDPGRVTEVEEWIVGLAEGHYFCVVTAYSVALGESAPSNEWEGTVIDWSAAALRVKQ